MTNHPSVESPKQPEPTVGTRLRNFLVVIVAIALSVTLFVGLRTETTSVTLAQLEAMSTPLDVALTNGKPSFMEFYANWCTVCQKMAPDIAKLEQQYGARVNFIMLNVDNTKWLPEMLRYRVDGIPHFVYLNQDGEPIAQAIGNQPHSVMASNINALVAGESLPYAQASGQVSKFATPVMPKSSQDDPRSHGSQVNS